MTTYMTLPQLKDVTESFLNEWANEFTVKEWNKMLDIPININNRLRSKNGYFRFYPNGRPIEIGLNVKGCKSIEELIGVLKHELCHWHCFTEGLQYDDGTKDFESMLLSVGAPSTFVGLDQKRSRTIQNIVSKYGSVLKAVTVKKVDCNTNDYKALEVFTESDRKYLMNKLTSGKIRVLAYNVTFKSNNETFTVYSVKGYYNYFTVEGCKDMFYTRKDAIYHKLSMIDL